jgi:apolipoprotein N-acyltransferase
VDPWGRVGVETAEGVQAVVRSGVRSHTDLTPYARLGNAFALVCLLVAAGALRRR